MAPENERRRSHSFGHQKLCQIVSCSLRIDSFDAMRWDTRMMMAHWNVLRAKNKENYNTNYCPTNKIPFSAPQQRHADMADGVTCSHSDSPKCSVPFSLHVTRELNSISSNFSRIAKWIPLCLYLCALPRCCGVCSFSIRTTRWLKSDNFDSAPHTVPNGEWVSEQDRRKLQATHLT